MKRVVNSAQTLIKREVSIESTSYPLQQVILLISLIILSSTVYAWSQFRDLSENLIPTLLLSACLWVAFTGLKTQQRNKVLALLLVAMTGVAGILLGSIADFGRLGIALFNELCRPNANLTLMQDMTRMFVIAPATHTGMLLGCLGGLAISDSAAVTKSSARLVLTRHGLHLLGMCGAMILAQALIRANLLNGVAINTAPFLSPIVLMWVLMVVTSVLLIGLFRTRE